MDTRIVTLPENISAAVDQLADAILNVKPVADYQRAKARMDNDPDALKLLETLSKAQSELRIRQSQNGVTQADVDQLRSIQRQVQANQVIMDYARTQQSAIGYLPEVNQEISLLLGFDFAALAGQGNC